MVRLLLLVLVILLSGCGGGKCIEPGLGVSTNSTEVKVPVMPEGADSKNPARYWVNSGYRVEEGKELKLTVERTINFCPVSTKAPPTVVRMYQDYFSTEPKRFHNSHIDVLPGDQLTFTAHTYDFDYPPCSKIVNGDSPLIYYDDNTVFKDGNCKKAIPAEQICSSGAAPIVDVPSGAEDKKYKLYMKEAGGNCRELDAKISFPKVGGGHVRMPRLQFPLGYIGIVDRVSSNVMKTSAKHVVASGKLHDARTIRMQVPIELTTENCELFKKSEVSTTLENLLSVKQLSNAAERGRYTRKYETEKKNTDSVSTLTTPGQPAVEEKDKKKIAQMLREYTEYDINCNCGFICSPDKKMGDKDCVRTIVSVLNNKLVCPTPVGDLKALSLYDNTGTGSSSAPNITIPDLTSKNMNDLKKAVESIKILESSATTKALKNDNKSFKEVHEKTYELAEGVVAVIVDPKNKNYRDKGNISNYCSYNEKCKYLPETITGLQRTKFSDGNAPTFATGSLKLNHVYEVKDAGRVMLVYWPPLDELNQLYHKGKAAKAKVVLAYRKSGNKFVEQKGTKYYEPTMLDEYLERRFWHHDESTVSKNARTGDNALSDLRAGGPAIIVDQGNKVSVPKQGKVAVVTTQQSTVGIPQDELGTALRGFYALDVHRTCYATGGKKLYMYIGETPPTVGVDENARKTLGSDIVELDLEAERDKRVGSKMHNGSYVINKKDSGEKKKGYLYFAVDVDPGYEAELKKSDSADNYYSVRLWIPRWTPIFSRFFVYLQGTILHVLYGTEAPVFSNDSKVQDVSQALSKALGEDRTSGTKKKIGAVQQIYNNQVVSKPFWNATRAVLVLYLMFSVLGYIIGVIQITKYDLSVRVAKMALIAMLVSPSSWKFFNEHCFSLFTVGIPDIISAFNGYLGGDSAFVFLDSTIGLFITSEFWLRMLSLLTAGPVGWLLLFGIAWALWSLFVAMISAIIKYLFVMVALAFLITLAPLFITFLLFQYTRGIFDGWLKMIVNFALQPIILFAALAFLNQVIVTSLHAVTDFAACESCAVGFDLSSKDPESPGKKDICIIPALLPIGYSNELSVDDRIREGLARNDTGFMGLPFSVAMVLILILACKATSEFVQISETLAHSISGSVSGIAASAVGATQAMLGVVGLDHMTQSLIKSARSMTPPHTEKIKFEGKGLSQPRHDAVARHGAGVPGISGEDVGHHGDDRVSGGSQARRGTRGLDELLEDRVEGGNTVDDDRYSELPRHATSSGTGMQGRGGRNEHLYESIGDLSDTASIASGEYENMDNASGGSGAAGGAGTSAAQGFSGQGSEDIVSSPERAERLEVGLGEYGGSRSRDVSFEDVAQGSSAPTGNTQSSVDNTPAGGGSGEEYGLGAAHAAGEALQHDKISGATSGATDRRQDMGGGSSERRDSGRNRSASKSSGSSGDEGRDIASGEYGDMGSDTRDRADIREFEDLLSDVQGTDADEDVRSRSGTGDSKDEDVAEGGGAEEGEDKDK
ncbi:type IV secretion system protein [Candidatus Anaplasma sp. TIGMIC]|uniref:type IV secretion system protein n=1 Tax=Candidatus Anaplasma sp. TIGMIC TaxID=3020713 RepID=UPI0023310C71|nr:type IV secretion system protein [Candidatus Anaplasma sp. TIGMIC]MDB1134993.1 type IV secretion system protein [Candidatus Anaplasma sp. TIGMIC]